MRDMMYYDKVGDIVRINIKAPQLFHSLERNQRCEIIQRQLTITIIRGGIFGWVVVG